MIRLDIGVGGSKRGNTFVGATNGIPIQTQHFTCADGRAIVSLLTVGLLACWLGLCICLRNIKMIFPFSISAQAVAVYVSYDIVF